MNLQQERANKRLAEEEVVEVAQNILNLEFRYQNEDQVQTEEFSDDLFGPITGRRNNNLRFDDTQSPPPPPTFMQPRVTHGDFTKELIKNANAQNRANTGARAKVYANDNTNATNYATNATSATNANTDANTRYANMDTRGNNSWRANANMNANANAHTANANATSTSAIDRAADSITCMRMMADAMETI